MNMYSNILNSISSSEHAHRLLINVEMFWANNFRESLLTAQQSMGKGHERHIGFIGRNGQVAPQFSSAAILVGKSKKN